MLKHEEYVGKRTYKTGWRRLAFFDVTVTFRFLTSFAAAGVNYRLRRPKASHAIDMTEEKMAGLIALKPDIAP
jgi:hypothetical protein